MTKILVFGSLLLFVTGAEGLGKVQGDQPPALQAPQLKDGADKDQKKVTVRGAVKKPGAISWEKGLTLKKALAQAGGLANLANKKKVKVTRKGKTTVYNLEKLKKNVAILPGDLIEVVDRLW